MDIPWDFKSNIINKEAMERQKKLPGSPQEATKISGQKSRNNFIGILGETNFS